MDRSQPERVSQASRLLGLQERCLGQSAILRTSDEAVDRSRLVGPLGAERLCRYVLSAVFVALSEGDECETLFALLGASLYDDNADEKDVTT